MLNYNKMLKFYVYTALSFIFYLVFDFAYAELSMTNSYMGGNAVDIFYFAAYLFLLLGFRFKCRQTKSKLIAAKNYTIGGKFKKGMLNGKAIIKFK